MTDYIELLLAEQEDEEARRKKEEVALAGRAGAVMPCGGGENGESVYPGAAEGGGPLPTGRAARDVREGLSALAAKVESLAEGVHNARR